LKVEQPVKEMHTKSLIEVLISLIFLGKVLDSTLVDEEKETWLDGQLHQKEHVLTTLEVFRPD